MSDIPGGADDPLTVRHDALSLAFEALCRRLLAGGALRAEDLPTMRAAALDFPNTLQANPNSKLQVSGARLTEAVNALFDRLDGTDWKPISAEDIWRSARLIVAQHGRDGAVAFAWQRVQELTAHRDRPGVETWCWILDAIEELVRQPSP